MNGIISYENYSDLNKFILRVKEINCIDIELKDETQNFLNFNNIPWTITLSLEIIRMINLPEINKRSTFHDIVYKKKQEQIDITDLKEVPEDTDDDLEILLYKASMP